MIKILMVVGKMNVGGIENYVMNILRNVDKNLVNIDLLYITEEPCFYDVEIKKLGYNIIRIHSRSEDFQKHNKELKSVLKKNNYDVVHINYGTGMCFFDAMISKRCGVKKVIVHSHNSKGMNKTLNLILKTFLSNYTDEKVACSKQAAEWMFRSKDAKSVKVLNNFIDLSRFKFNHESRVFFRDKYNIKKDEFIIGEIARFNEQKNQNYLIDIIKKTPSNYIFLFVGEGNLVGEFKKNISENNIRDRVIMIKNVKDPENYLNMMDLFVMPSLYEGLPLSLIEAQTNGLHCIVSKNIDSKADITGNVVFLPVDEMAKDEWVKMINDIFTINNRDEKAIEKVKKAGYSIESNIQNLYSLWGGVK